MKIKNRIKQRIIEPDWLTFLYDEVLLALENDTVDFSGYNLTKNPFLSKLESDMGFTFNTKMKEAEERQVDTFYFSSSDGKIESWFKHLRNALAHNRIFKQPQGDGLIVEDQHQGKLTMYAEVSSFDKLRSIITEIKKNYKK